MLSVRVLVVVGKINVWIGESIARQEGKSASSVGKQSEEQMANGMGEGAAWRDCDDIKDERVVGMS